MSARDVVCFSRTRWDWAGVCGVDAGRTRELMLRAARTRRVFFVEEAVFGPQRSRVESRVVADSLIVLRPRVRIGTPAAEVDAVVAALVAVELSVRAVDDPVVWLSTPMALGLASEIDASVVVYDVVDDLVARAAAYPTFDDRERQLLHEADVVFASGPSLYEASERSDVFLFPSPEEEAQFHGARDLAARSPMLEPADQRDIPHPRVGYCGVLDERVDIDMLDRAAAENPDIHWVLVGPAFDAHEAQLPRRENIHYLGWRATAELPRYVAFWDLALVPFVPSEAARLTSPALALEYLAAGKSVVTTGVEHVAREGGASLMSANVETFAPTVRAALHELEELRAAGVATQPANDDQWERMWGVMAAILEDAAMDRSQQIPTLRVPTRLSFGVSMTPAA